MYYDLHAFRHIVNTHRKANVLYANGLLALIKFRASLDCKCVRARTKFQTNAIFFLFSYLIRINIIFGSINVDVYTENKTTRYC